MSVFRGLQIFVLSFFISAPAWAWGRRAHSIVCQTAAYLVADQPGADFLKNHSFDLGYYCNVPDLIWKEPPTYRFEAPNHHMNLEVFERQIPKADLEKAFAMDRKTFAKTYPKIAEMAGRSWWRIRELNDQLGLLKAKLLSSDLKVTTRHELQAQWLLYSGLIGHYVGDLSMPLHATENHDGKLTHQEGIHFFFEDALVNELFNTSDNFELEAEVQKAAKARWQATQTTLEKRTLLQLLQDLSAESTSAAQKLLKVDKDTGRDLTKATKAHKQMLVENIATGSVYVAEIWRRSLGFRADDNRFYNFISTPGFIPPPK